MQVRDVLDACFAGCIFLPVERGFLGVAAFGFAAPETFIEAASNFAALVGFVFVFRLIFLTIFASKWTDCISPRVAGCRLWLWLSVLGRECNAIWSFCASFFNYRVETEKKGLWMAALCDYPNSSKISEPSRLPN
jgi:hypothetical protein